MALPITEKDVDALADMLGDMNLNADEQRDFESAIAQYNADREALRNARSAYNAAQDANETKRFAALNKTVVQKRKKFIASMRALEPFRARLEDNKVALPPGQSEPTPLRPDDRRQNAKKKKRERAAPRGGMVAPDDDDAASAQDIDADADAASAKRELDALRQEAERVYAANDISIVEKIESLKMLKRQGLPLTQRLGTSDAEWRGTTNRFINSLQRDNQQLLRYVDAFERARELDPLAFELAQLSRILDELNDFEESANDLAVAADGDKEGPNYEYVSNLAAEAITPLVNNETTRLEAEEARLQQVSDLDAVNDVRANEGAQSEVSEYASDVESEFSREDEANERSGSDSETQARDALFEEDVDEALDDAEAELDVRVVLPASAAFPIEAVKKGESAATFLDLVFGAGDADKWSRSEPDEDGDVTFTLKNVKLDTIDWFVTKLFGRILARWASDDADLGASVQSLWTDEWTESTVPFATAFALELYKRQQLTDGANDQLNSAINYFRRCVEFVIAKGLVGVETATGVPFNTQSAHARATSFFDDVKAFASNPSVMATLARGNTPTDATTKNQLLSFDEPLKDRSGRTPATSRKRNSDPSAVRGIVGAPLIKMAFLTQAVMREQELAAFYKNSGERLFEIDGGDPTPVRFGRLRTDSTLDYKDYSKPPAAEFASKASLQSFESTVARIFALPLLDALYIDEMRALGIEPSEQMLQDVGNDLSETFYMRLGALPKMFVVKSVDAADVTYQGDEVRVQLTLPAFSESKAPLGSDIQAIAPVDTATQRIYPFAPGVLESPPTAETVAAARTLLWPALVSQIANLANLWGPPIDSKDVWTSNLPTQKRYIAAHRIVAGVMFAQVALTEDEVSTSAVKGDKSLFGRIARRPSFKDNSGKLQYLRTAAAPVSARTMESEAFNFATVRRLAGLRKGLKPLDKAIAADKDKRRISGFIANIDAIRETLAAPDADITVLVPTDEALEKLGRLPADFDLRDTLLFHTLDSTPSFKAMRDDLQPSRLTTLLKDAQGLPFTMKVRVERNYDTDRGGSLTVTARDPNISITFTTSETRMARNGNYVIVDIVLNYEVYGIPVAPLASKPTAELPPPPTNEPPQPFVGAYGDVSEATPYAGMPEAPYGELALSEQSDARLNAMAGSGTKRRVDTLALHSASQARQAQRNERDFAPFARLMRVSGAEAALRSAREQGHHVAVLAPTPRALTDAGLAPQALAKKSDAELAALPGIGAFCKRHVVEGHYTLDEQPNKPLRAPLRSADFMHMMGNSAPQPLRTLASDTKLGVVAHKTRKSARSAAERREGLHLGDLDLRRAPTHTYPGDDQVYVHFAKRVLAPAPRLTSAAAAAGAKKTVASASDGRDNARKLTAMLAKYREEMSESSSESSDEESAADDAAKEERAPEAADDDDDDDASSSSNDAKMRQSRAAPEPARTVAKESAPLAPNKAALRASTSAASVASKWRQAVTDTAAELRKSKNYTDVAQRVSAHIEALGGAETLAKSVDAQELRGSFGKLSQAVARNQHVKSDVKARAHDALDKLARHFD